MLSTDVQRSFGDAYLEATAAMRSRFEARVLEADSWTEGLALALERPGRRRARRSRDGTHDGHRRALRPPRHAVPLRRGSPGDDRLARTRLAAPPRGPRALSCSWSSSAARSAHVIAGAIARDELDDLHARLFGLLAFADERDS